MKKIAVMIYPNFSMQEISCLTDGLKVYFDVDVEVFAASTEPVRTEDNFLVTAEHTFGEFDPEEYGCLILPGIYDPIPALFDERNIAFLRSLKGKNILISSISSSPMLLAKAGLLDDVRFTCGAFEEVCQALPSSRGKIRSTGRWSGTETSSRPSVSPSGNSRRRPSGPWASTNAGRDCSGA